MKATIINIKGYLEKVWNTKIPSDSDYLSDIEDALERYNEEAKSIEYPLMTVELFKLLIDSGYDDAVSTLPIMDELDTALGKYTSCMLEIYDFINIIRFLSEFDEACNALKEIINNKE